MCQLESKGHGHEYKIFAGLQERVLSYTGRSDYVLNLQAGTGRSSMYSMYR